MPNSEFRLDNGTPIGNNHPLALIAGPCVIESEELCLKVCEGLKKATDKLGVPYVFKASFDKANRSSVKSFRGPGIEEGLRILKKVKTTFDVPVLTDIHDITQVDQAAAAVDILQIPAFLCRQTDLLIAAAKTGKVINVKKGQFMAPWDMLNVWNKLEEGGLSRAVITERGASFGYNNLVVDMRSLMYFRDQQIPVCMDATHAVQLPGGQGDASGGQREYVSGISTTAVSLGISMLFWEVHTCPDEAKCDGPNQLFLDSVEPLLSRLVELDQWAKQG